MRTRHLLALVLPALLLPAPAVHAEERPPVPHYLSVHVTFPCAGCGPQDDGTISGTAIGSALPDTLPTKGPVTGTFWYDVSCTTIGSAGGSFDFAGNQWDFFFDMAGTVPFLMAGHDFGISIVGPAAFVPDPGTSLCSGAVSGTLVAAFGVLPYPGPSMLN